MLCIPVWILGYHYGYIIGTDHEGTFHQVDLEMSIPDDIAPFTGATF